MDTESNYKEHHESYMSNNNGSTPLETVLVITPTLMSALLVTGVKSHFSDHSSSLVAFFLEYCCIVLPTIVSFTVMSDHLALLISSIVCAGFGTMATGVAVHIKNLDMASVANIAQKFLSIKIVNKRRPYITNVRALTNLVTVLCILAVDFKIFPRRYAKTETFGYAIMDIGVGMFVVVNALVAPETRNEISRRETLRMMVLSNVPLGLLGFGRLLATRNLNYQEHISEYGKDWNFFFTLVITKFICSFVMKFVKRSTLCYLLISGILIAGYETLLNLGLGDWIFSEAPRIDFVTANREGLASNAGYIALYFGGVALGRLLHKWDKMSGKSNVILAARLICLSVFLWYCTICCEHRLGVSRRLANLGYYLWVLSFTTTLLSVLIISETFALLAQVLIGGKNEIKIVFVPTIAEAINYNGLLFFLAGNVLTGLINLSVKTLMMDPASSILILMGYMLVNCVFVVIMFRAKTSFKIS